MTEVKLSQWTNKFGNQDAVEELLVDYIDFVENQRMAESWDKTLTGAKKQAEIYKTGGAGILKL